MSKHTPGPWIVGFGDTHEMGHVFGVGIDTKPNWTPVCLLSLAADTNSTDHANADLIAAAPEMLDALKMFLEYNDQGGPMHFDTDKMWTQARAAIAKATGQVMP